jgi:hypothetical protein
MTATWKALSASPLILVTDGKKDKVEGRDALPREGFPYPDADK